MAEGGQALGDLVGTDDADGDAVLDGDGDEDAEVLCEKLGDTDAEAARVGDVDGDGVVDDETVEVALQMTAGKSVAAAAAGGDDEAQSGMITTAPLVQLSPTLFPGYHGENVELICAVVPVPERPNALFKESVHEVPPPPLNEP